MRFHVQSTGRHAGEMVRCPAKVRCTLTDADGGPAHHGDFASARDAGSWNRIHASVTGLAEPLQDTLDALAVLEHDQSLSEDTVMAVIENESAAQLGGVVHRLPRPARDELDSAISASVDVPDATPAVDGDPDEGDAPSPARVTTLLTERVPLGERRVGNVPELKADDDSVSAQRRLARYINANFEGDRQRATMEALESMYGSEVVPIESSDYGVSDEYRRSRRAEQAERYRRRLEDRSGGPVRVYWQDGHSVFVPDRPCRSRLDNRFTNTDMPVDIVSFGTIQAAAVVVDHMDLSHAVAVPGPESAEVGRVDEIEDDEARAKAAARVRRYVVKGLTCTDRNDWYARLLNTDSSGRVRDGKGGHRIATASMVHYGDEYRRAVSDVLRSESNGEMNKAYAARASSEHTATVWEDKRNRDPEHDKAGRDSEFSRDFTRIEVDDSVDLGRLKAISDEYAGYRKALPPCPGRPELRFRMTGRHHAIGVYRPLGQGQMVVDPRHPSSFTHEYFHHLDFMSDSAGQVSLDPDFDAIVRHYQDTLDRSATHGNPDRYLAPTEIFARAGELWMCERVRGSSFLDDDKGYGTFDYRPLLEMHDEVMRFFNRHFGK